MTFIDVQEDDIDLGSWALAIIDNAKTSGDDWIDFLKAVKENFSQMDQYLKQECKSAATALIKLHLLDNNSEYEFLSEFSHIIDIQDIYEHCLPGMTPTIFRLFLTNIDFEEKHGMVADCRLVKVYEINFWRNHDMVHCLDIIANCGHHLSLKELIFIDYVSDWQGSVYFSFPSFSVAGQCFSRGKSLLELWVTTFLQD